MNDLLNETPLSLTQAAALLSTWRGGLPMDRSTLSRWISSGIKASNGTSIRLEAIKLGGRWLTTVEALRRFAAALTPGSGDAIPLPRGHTERQRASERAAAELARMGA